MGRESVMVIHPVLRLSPTLHCIFQQTCSPRETRGKIGVCRKILKDRLFTVQTEAAYLSVESGVLHDLPQRRSLLASEQIFRKGLRCPLFLARIVHLLSLDHIRGGSGHQS